MEGIRKVTPKESLESGEPPQHRLDLYVGGVVVGSAEIEYFSKPLPYYQLSSLYVEYEHAGKGYASQLMDQVEEWLRKRKKPGVLIDGIDEGSPAAGMYQRRGWKPVPHTPTMFVYNWPADVSLDVLKGLGSRGAGGGYN